MRISRATSDDQDRVVANMSWCKRHGVIAGGWPFGDDLAGPGGIHVELFMTGNATDRAPSVIDIIKSSRDVLAASVTVCPPSWFMVSGICNEWILSQAFPCEPLPCVTIDGSEYLVCEILDVSGDMAKCIVQHWFTGSKHRQDVLVPEIVKAWGYCK
jgi:hypothetical protein